MAIGIPKMPSMAKQSKISHGKLFRILLSICSWLKLCFVISQAYRTRPRTIKSMTCRIPYSVKCTSNEFITCFSPIHKIVSQNFAFHFLEGCKMPFSVMNKGKLISKCPFGVIVWTKIPTKFFPGFLP